MFNLEASEKSLSLEERRRKRLRWLIVSRVVIATFLLGVLIFIDFRQTSWEPEIQTPSFYGLLLATYLISFLVIVSLKFVASCRWHAYLQMAGDILLITGLIHLTGGVSSIYSVLYPMVIIYTVLFAERKGGFAAATACIFSYSMLLNLEYFSILDPPLLSILPEIEHNADFVYSRILVHALSFYAVAFLASFVTEQEKTASILLLEKENAFDQLDLLHRSIIESIDAGILTINLEGQIKSFNRAATEITGLSSPEVLNRNIREVFPGYDSLAEKYSHLQNDAADRRLEMTFQSPEGEERTLGCSRSQLKGIRGEHIGEILIFRNLTSIKKMEAAYENSRRLAFIGEMAAGLAHEIRNPLAAISGSIQMLRKDLTLEPTDERLMKIILRGKDQLENFMRDFLLLAKPAAGRRERVPLNELIDEILESLTYLPDWREKITVERSFSAPVMLWANKAEIQQVVWNLILNALQAMPQGGCLSVRTALPEISGGRQWVRLQIEDNGEGISPEDKEKIFQPFFTTKERGTGLGMAVVGRIVENYAGILTIDSEQGKGTVIAVDLPTAPDARESERPGLQDEWAA